MPKVFCPGKTLNMFLSNLVIPKRNLAPFWSVQLPTYRSFSRPSLHAGREVQKKIRFLELQGPNCLNFKGLLHSMQLDQKLFRLLITLPSTRHSDIVTSLLEEFEGSHWKKHLLFHLFPLESLKCNVIQKGSSWHFSNQTLCQLDPTGHHQATPRNPDNPPLNRNIYIPLDWT